MITIMMGKIEMVLPDMYMINRFIGTCFRGPRATSQLRFIFRLGSVSLNNINGLNYKHKKNLKEEK
jgi:hypothetical protein